MILLYSFEGTTFRYSDNNDGDTPISMPNIEVKPIGAESTWLEAAWKDRTLLNKETHHRDVMSFFSVLSYQSARSYIEMKRTRTCLVKNSFCCQIQLMDTGYGQFLGNPNRHLPGKTVQHGKRQLQRIRAR